MRSLKLSLTLLLLLLLVNLDEIDGAEEVAEALTTATISYENVDKGLQATTAFLESAVIPQIPKTSILCLNGGHSEYNSTTKTHTCRCFGGFFGDRCQSWLCHHSGSCDADRRRSACRITSEEQSHETQLCRIVATNDPPFNLPTAEGEKKIVGNEGVPESSELSGTDRVNKSLRDQERCLADSSIALASAVCNCPPSAFGQFCQYLTARVNPHDHRCKHGQWEIDEQSGSEVCRCHKGYKGDECSQKHCYNKGVLVLDTICLCSSSNYLGRYCEFVSCSPPFNGCELDTAMIDCSGRNLTDAEECYCTNYPHMWWSCRRLAQVENEQLRIINGKERGGSAGSSSGSGGRVRSESELGKSQSTDQHHQNNGRNVSNFAIFFILLTGLLVAFPFICALMSKVFQLRRLRHGGGNVVGGIVHPAPNQSNPIHPSRCLNHQGGGRRSSPSSSGWMDIFSGGVSSVFTARNHPHQHQHVCNHRSSGPFQFGVFATNQYQRQQYSNSNLRQQQPEHHQYPFPPPPPYSVSQSLQQLGGDVVNNVDNVNVINHRLTSPLSIVVDDNNADEQQAGGPISIVTADGGEQQQQQRTEAVPTTAAAVPGHRHSCCTNNNDNNRSASLLQILSVPSSVSAAGHEQHPNISDLGSSILPLEEEIAPPPSYSEALKLPRTPKLTISTAGSCSNNNSS